MTKLQDKAFLDQFRVNHPQTQTTLNIRGFEYPCIGQLQSHWSDISVCGSMSSAFLSQDGHATFVNPDKDAAIAFFTLDIHSYNFWSGKFDPTEQSSIELIVHPRDGTSLSPGQRARGIRPVLTFADELARQMPDAPFVREYIDPLRMMKFAFGPHISFVERHLGELAKAAPRGLRVYDAYVYGHTPPAVFSRLFDAPMLSTNPEIRQGFKDIFSGILGGQAQLLPRTTQLLEMHP